MFGAIICVHQRRIFRQNVISEYTDFLENQRTVQWKQIWNL